MLKITAKAQSQLLIRDTHNLPTDVCLAARWYLLFNSPKVDLILAYHRTEYLVKSDDQTLVKGPLTVVLTYLDGLEHGALTCSNT